MSPDLIARGLPDPDPGFLKILQRLPDPDGKAEPGTLRALPKMQELYIRKRDAFRRKDFGVFQQVLNEEIQFVREFAVFAYHY